MGNLSFELREFFHLSFLRHLSLRLHGRAYAVKGGICLRFFHRSPRFSQDMDLDVSPQIGVKTVQNAVDSILQSRSFLASLIPYGVARVQVVKPKQTETTQRWKAGLVLSAQTTLPTKIELSRRQGKVSYVSGVPDAELLNFYKTAPFAAQFYDAIRMTAHKISALASLSRTAARDLFDLHHLLYALLVKREDVVKIIDQGAVERAADKTGGFTHRDFKEQVVPYLTETMMALYEQPEAFEKLKEEVEQALIGMIP